MAEEVKDKGGRPSPKRSYASRPLTQERIDHFLLVLSETGSRAAAARAATPWGEGQSPGYSTFAKLWKSNPDFAELCDDAYKEFIGGLNAEIIRRAMTPTERPIFHLGEEVGKELKYDNHLLMQVAKARQREVWGDRSEVEHTGQINHGVMVVNAQLATDEAWEEKFSKAIPAECEEVEEKE